MSLVKPFGIELLLIIVGSPAVVAGPTVMALMERPPAARAFDKETVNLTTEAELAVVRFAKSCPVMR